MVALGGVLEDLGGIVGGRQAGGEVAQGVFRRAVCGGRCGAGIEGCADRGVGFPGRGTHGGWSIVQQPKARAMELKHTGTAVGTGVEMRFNGLVIFTTD